MTQPVENVLHAALRGLGTRQQVTANNIANADTPGFRASVVHFEDRLQRVLKAPLEATSSVDQVQPTVAEAPGGVGKTDGNTVDLDQEFVSMTDTTMRYNAVARSLNDRLSLYRAIVTDRG